MLLLQWKQQQQQKNWWDFLTVFRLLKFIVDKLFFPPNKHTVYIMGCDYGFYQFIYWMCQPTIDRPRQTNVKKEIWIYSVIVFIAHTHCYITRGKKVFFFFLKVENNNDDNQQKEKKKHQSLRTYSIHTVRLKLTWLDFFLCWRLLSAWHRQWQIYIPY